ncbi:hypothetical protein N9444_08300 [Gammaproteobacteria bacterium]|nr:hypothetical protein [Gammaproteobacteria bacterium]
MKQLLLVVLLVFAGESSALPQCPSSGVWHNCIGTATNDEGQYVGEFSYGKRHGQGTNTWSSGSKYVGGWQDDKEHGQGTHIWTDGTKYVGEHKDGKRHGEGVYTFADGREILGEFKFGKAWNAVAYDASGKSVFSFKNGVPQ